MPDLAAEAIRLNNWLKSEKSILPFSSSGEEKEKHIEQIFFNTSIYLR